MIFTLFLVTLVAGMGMWFYKRRQIDTLNEQLKDKDAIISALTSHVEEKPQNNSTRKGPGKGVSRPTIKSRPKTPASQNNKSRTHLTDGVEPRRRRSYKPKEK